ncbi:MAG: aldo/keto reductase [Burkholderiales bacterium]|jgi:aryl-alcohol dehydrogenase-like predicted oxidoreductase|nr:aldo/keto reductase [Burkholderiales bacterium]
MEYTTLGRTGLKVSVAGLGCGGNSKLGLGTGHDKAHAVGIVQRALDLGVNLIDTAQYYGTEAAVGAAIHGRARDSIVISTKHKVSLIDGTVFSVAEILAGLDRSLRALGTDHVDVFCLHTVLPQEYERVLTEVVPPLLREKEKGKFRFLGITEFAGRDPRHDMLARALEDDCWDVMMVAFHMLNQNARQRVFPATQQKNIGTLLMFAVRAIFSVAGRLQDDITELAAAGRVPKWLAEKKNPLDFLLHDQGARNIIEAAYRYARHEPGANVVLFGTGNPDHIEPNIKAILQPPLPAADRQKIAELFGALEGVGLDEIIAKR